MANLCNQFYNEQNEQNEISNYQWYSDNSKLDQIGINSDCTILMHDNIIYNLVKFKMVDNILTKQLIYKLNNKLNNKTNSKDFFTDLIFGEKSNYMIICYQKNSSGLMKFSHILFNGKKFN